MSTSWEMPFAILCAFLTTQHIHVFHPNCKVKCVFVFVIIPVLKGWAFSRATKNEAESRCRRATRSVWPSLDHLSCDVPRGVKLLVGWESPFATQHIFRAKNCLKIFTFVGGVGIGLDHSELTASNSVGLPPLTLPIQLSRKFLEK